MTGPSGPSDDDALDALKTVVVAAYTKTGGHWSAHITIPRGANGTPDAPSDTVASGIRLPPPVTAGGDNQVVDALNTLWRWAESLPVIHSWHNQ